MPKCMNVEYACVALFWPLSSGLCVRGSVARALGMAICMTILQVLSYVLCRYGDTALLLAT